MSYELKPDIEPTVTNSPVPVWIIMVMLVALYLGMIYFDRHSGWFDKQVYSPFTSAENLTMYQPQSGEATVLARSRKVYESVCGVCHGNDGLGKPNQYPPLAGSELVAKDIQSLVRIPQLGFTGSINVSGQLWNLTMPPMGANLSDADLAGALSYIRQSWGNHSSAVSADDVKAARAAIAGDHSK
jgi:mono/diheme cytochrome c family protein